MQNKAYRVVQKGQGFTLLEVMVAFVVLGLLLGISFQVVTTSLNSQVKSTDYEIATMHAQSLLARIGNDIPLKDKVSNGELTHGFVYKISVKDYVDPDAGFNELTKGAFLLVEIQIVKADDNFEYSILTLRPNPDYKQLP